MNKKIYVVSSSDGEIIGTCSNMKNAYNVASNYFHESHTSKLKSYARVCDDFRHLDYVRPNAEIHIISLRIPCEYKLTKDTLFDVSITKTYLNKEIK